MQLKDYVVHLMIEWKCKAAVRGIVKRCEHLTEYERESILNDILPSFPSELFVE